MQQSARMIQMHKQLVALVTNASWHVLGPLQIGL